MECELKKNIFGASVITSQLKKEGKMDDWTERE
jgi:hypothetical protein